MRVYIEEENMLKASIHRVKIVYKKIKGQL